MDEKNEVGIEKIKKVVKATIDLGQSAAEKSKEGFTLVEIVSLVVEAFGKLSFTITDYESIAEEATNLTPKEWDELVDYFAAEFDIDNELAEEKIELAVQLLSDLAYFVSLFMKKTPEKSE